VSFLATAYKGMPPAISTQLEAVLLENVTSSNDSIRLCAVQWASRLFPFSHPPARYVNTVGPTHLLEKREEPAGERCCGTHRGRNHLVRDHVAMRGGRVLPHNAPTPARTSL
jgi:hypothetical protein